MYLNTFYTERGNKRNKKRVGRGIGSGLGKTCGKGHKGQKSRSGCKINRSFEGGQTPLNRRLPKFGFISRKQKKFQEIRLNELSKIDGNDINLSILRSFKIINRKIKYVKIINTGNINKFKNIIKLKCTSSVKKILIQLGGNIKE
ncbi:50S ribosomal protein L15 [Enterobacteriaceae endosymbiont of Neohaemonia nigricornis]|uniref:50S ribosomal protein L15 n=1 Tax=Enterobacteriaceae endosymbiont of Neohaemonia nigricornis TaxID=2675792 RepID=UPI0014492006|nr:50S ribosomal protein L15 [Enterobacteriaceae endosymbiont of Neohaemonia nigricornis]QJC30451.1 50S ribosomal protein L15 [Enterobacteriaceae endosymbiont of Neohaemonia nigricornis]